MEKRIAFFSDELSEASLKAMTPKIRADAEQFKRQCELGPADGEQDIDWQEDGQGYYAHLHELVRLRSESEDSYSDYRTKLMSEIESMSAESTAYQMAMIVKEQL